MSRVTPIRPATAKSPEPESWAEAVEPIVSQCREIVALEPLADAPAHLSQSRPQAAFVAHLIATAHHAPQTREKRRAEPQEAVGRYAATGQPRQTKPGGSFKRAI